MLMSGSLDVHWRQMFYRVAYVEHLAMSCDGLYTGHAG